MSKQHKPNGQTIPNEQTTASGQSISDGQSIPSEQSTPEQQPKPRRKRKLRSRYKKASDKVFNLTGMPLTRLLSIVISILFVTGLVLYIRYQGSESLPSSIEVPNSQFESGESEEQDYITAVTIPADFSKSSLPVRIDKVDWMIERCNYLLNQKSDYSDKIEEKMLALLALKAVMMAESGLDPIPHLDLLRKRVAQSSGSAAQKDKHQYLLVVTYLTALASMPEAKIDEDAMEAISGIQESTPVPPATAISCYNSCLKYYVNSIDKTVSGELLRLMGRKLSISSEQRLSDLGLSLIDYPNFSYYYQESFNQQKSGTRFETETQQLIKQIKQTPPQSVKTYDLLLTVPEQYLQAGNKKVALKILNEFTSTLSESSSQVQEKVLERLEKLRTRINLLGKKFPLSGVDANGNNIEPSKKEKTLIIFWDPDGTTSDEPLVRIADSRLFDRWSTAVLLATVSELTVEEIASVKRKYSNFKVVGGPTVIDWMERSGVNDLPYMIRIDQEGIVRRLSTP